MNHQSKSRRASSITIQLPQLIGYLLFIVALGWFLYAIQMIGFLTLGEGGYLISAQMYMAYVPMWHSLLVLILLVLGLIHWKIIPVPHLVLAASLGPWILGWIFSTYDEDLFELVTPFIGFILVLVVSIIYRIEMRATKA